MTPIDYENVAELYDAFVSTDIDFRFFRSEVAEVAGNVLELTCGTGRLSIPLIEAGAQLTCVDRSAGMLSVLSRKLQERDLNAELVCQDVCNLQLHHTFDLAILPFQSFMEILGERNQRQALAAVFSALEPNGRFICTMHNPLIRRQSVDGVLRVVNDVPFEDGRLVVSGVETGDEKVISRLQFFEFFAPDGHSRWRRLQPMQFELIEFVQFKEMARDTGFVIDAVLGDYRETPFAPETSPVMIWRLHKPA